MGSRREMIGEELTFARNRLNFEIERGERGTHKPGMSRMWHPHLLRTLRTIGSFQSETMSSLKVTRMWVPSSWGAEPCEDLGRGVFLCPSLVSLVMYDFQLVPPRTDISFGSGEWGKSLLARFPSIDSSGERRIRSRRCTSVRMGSLSSLSPVLWGLGAGAPIREPF